MLHKIYMANCTTPSTSAFRRANIYIYTKTIVTMFLLLLLFFGVYFCCFCFLFVCISAVKFVLRGWCLMDAFDVCLFVCLFVFVPQTDSMEA